MFGDIILSILTVHQVRIINNFMLKKLECLSNDCPSIYEIWAENNYTNIWPTMKLHVCLLALARKNYP